MAGSQDFKPDPRKAGALVYVNGELVRRDQARVSVFDGGFLVGDGIWEGLRLHRGRLLFLKHHLDRLYWGAQRIRLDIGLDREALVAQIQRTLDANGMRDGVHVRVMVTRGEKSAPNQDPRNAIGKATLVIVAEYKSPAASIVTQGLKLFTASIRCTPAEMFDMRLNSHSRLNLICALLEAIDAGGDEALMLDPHGFVSSCTATNFFFVRDAVVVTSSGQYCFNGISARQRDQAVSRARHPDSTRQFHVEDMYRADEAFVTGTFGGVTPVSEIDGRKLPAPLPGPITARLRALYEELKDAEAGAAP